jgi:hypothetical protein
MDRLISDDVIAEIIAAFSAAGIAPSDAAIHQLAEASGKTEVSLRNSFNARG